MNKIFKILIFILAIEICLGYLYYLKNSTIVTGHYVSSSLRAIDRVSNILNKKNFFKKKDTSKIDDKSKKEDEDKTSVILNNKSACDIYLNQNQHLNISGINWLRKPKDFQSNIDFLNSFDENKDFLILIAGNSETFGADQNLSERLHILLQRKLRDEIKSERIFVVNLATLGGMISDHLYEIKGFSEIYKPDLVIFYAGGNELSLTRRYEATITNNHLNKKNFSVYKFISTPNLLGHVKRMEHCLNQDLFLMKNNFTENSPILDVEKHIQFHFENIKKKFNNKSIEFLFYIQPLNKKISPSNELKFNFEKIINLYIDDDRFVNLNFTQINSKLDFKDLYHTRNAKLVSERLSKDIINKFDQNILKKLDK